MSSGFDFDTAPGTAGSPCTTCGACCASFRVSFYWGEGEDAPGGWVPLAFTRQLTLHLRVMRGTDQRQPRCEALAGDVGRAVRCTIYTGRPTPCREFNWHGEDGQPNPRCNDRRAAIGLPALPDSPDPTRLSAPTVPTELTSPVGSFPDVTPTRDRLNRNRGGEERA